MKTSLLTYTSFFISILAFMTCSYLLFNEKRFDADWGQIITGVLSFLVTILVAWQIWTIIDTKNIIKELKDKNDAIAINYALEYSRLSASIYYSMFDFYRKDGTQVYEYFKYGLLTLKHSIAIGDFGASNSMVQGLIESFPTKPIKNFNKASLLSMVNDIPLNDRLTNFETLKSKIILMPSNDNA